MRDPIATILAGLIAIVALLTLGLMEFGPTAAIVPWQPKAFMIAFIALGVAGFLLSLRPQYPAVMKARAR
jgi:hypothetical protein